MAYATADIVPNLSGRLPFKVVFKQGAVLLSEWPVATVAEGETQIVAALRGLGDAAPRN